LDINELEYDIEHVVTAKGAASSVNLNQLDDNLVPEVPAFNEFFDVLPEELSGMPPGRDIKFVIELVSGTSPIYIYIYETL
jgi:hypothetical protein